MITRRTPRTRSSPSSSTRNPSRATRRAALALIAAALVATPTTVRAQLGFLGLGGGGVVFDPSNFARNVLHYARRLEQMRMQEAQLTAQLEAMRKLHAPVFRAVLPTIAAADAALRAGGTTIAYSAPTVDGDFRRTFPGAQVFADYPADERAQAVRTLATLRAALDAASHAAQDVPAGVTRLEAMKAQLAAVRGHEAALELNGTVGLYGAEELTLLRQAVAALTNVHAVYYASEVNARAQERATYRARLAAMSAPASPHRYAPRSLRVDP